VSPASIHHVVHEPHAHDARDVHTRAGVLGQDDRRQRQVPRVVGAVLAPGAVAGRGLPRYRLAPVGLDDEGEVRRQPRRRVGPDGTGRAGHSPTRGPTLADPRAALLVLSRRDRERGATG
jgi:hypothetical protein